jgi:hypothetical protein
MPGRRDAVTLALAEPAKGSQLPSSDIQPRPKLWIVRVAKDTYTTAREWLARERPIDYSSRTTGISTNCPQAPAVVFDLATDLPTYWMASNDRFSCSCGRCGWNLRRPRFVEAITPTSMPERFFKEHPMNYKASNSTRTFCEKRAD